MHFRTLDIPAITRRLLAAPDADTRRTLFEADLIAPFQGLVARMGGQDALTMFNMWGMSPDQYTGASGAQMAALLHALEAADVWSRAESALYKAQEAFTARGHVLPDMETIFGLCLIQMDESSPAAVFGYSGFGAMLGWVMTTYWAATPENLRCVEAATAHEMHHNILATLRPPRMNVFQINVGDYMVMEGLAESFAAELYGADTVGPWARGNAAFDASGIAHFRDGLQQTGFETLRQYIFGDVAAGIPPFTGYALGYRVVQAYLAKTGCSVVEATFVEPAELIAESGVFAA